MHIFITGVSGFVGGAAARALIDDGHTVSAMSRSATSDQVIKDIGAQPVRCDLETVSAEHMVGADICIHSAAYVEAWGPKDAWYKGNVLGTKSVLAAATGAGVARFIHIGTEAGIVRGQHVVGADETYPLSPDSPYPYCATKAQAEQLVLTANTAEFNTIVLRPRLIWGVGDTTLLPVIQDMCARGNWSWIDNGKARTSSIYIDNLVHAIKLSLKGGVPGQAYFILDDEVHTMKGIITAMAATQNLKLGSRNTPAWLADLAGSVCESIWRLFSLKSEPPLTRHAAMVMSRDCVLNGAKAARELGYKSPVSFQAGLQAMQDATN